ncbi:MAG: amidohydrolase family protein [Caldilineaceae bacterium]|nr:amidohydrolase family protein [Caldilineaceae bacterium]
MLNQMIPILMNTAGVPLVEAIRKASLRPARVMRVEDRTGRSEAGKGADIAIFEDDFSAWRTMIGRQWAYAAT